MAEPAAGRERLLREHVPLRARGRRIARMGMSTALGGARRAPFWANFLVELHFDVVIADAPARSAGPRGEVGPAADAFLAEIEALAALGSDAIFVPLEVDGAGGASALVHLCPFVQAGAHLAPGGRVRIVRPVRFAGFPEETGIDSLARSLAPWCIASSAVERAVRLAGAAQERFERAVRADGGGVAPSGEDGLAAALASAEELPPGAVTLSGLVAAARAGGFTPARAAFLMALECAAHRRSLRDVLAALGREGVPAWSLDDPATGVPGFAAVRPIWHGMVALGMIEAVAFHLAPRARERGDAEEALATSREDVLDCLRTGRDPAWALPPAARRFRSVALEGGARPVRISLTGEGPAGAEPSADPQVARLIQEAGGEVVAPPFRERIYHVNRCVRVLARACGRAFAAWGLGRARRLLGGYEERARRILRRSGSPEPARQPTLDEIWLAAREAGLLPWLGEAALTFARARACRRRGARGVVNIVPEGLPGALTSQSVFASHGEWLRGMPVCHLPLGGDANDLRSRIDALVRAARDYRPPPEPPAPRSPKPFIRPSIYRFWARD